MWIGVALMTVGAIGPLVTDGARPVQGIFLVILAGYFTLQVIGVSYSPDTTDAWSKVLLKISLILIPFSAFLFADRLDRKTIVTGLNLFYTSSLISSIMLVITGMVTAQNTGQLLVFYEDFSILMHPAYASLVLCCAIIIGIYLKSKDHWGVRFLGAYFKPVSTVILLSTIFLLSSRIQMIAIVLVLLILTASRLASQTSTKQSKAVSLVLVVFMVGMSAIVIQSNDRIRNTITELRDVQIKPGDKLTSAKVRIVVWEICMNEFLNRPLMGSGTASSKTIIGKSESGQQFPQLAGGELGAHNQILTEAVNHGLPGVVMLFLILLIPLRFGISVSNPLLIGVLLLVAVSLTTESIFEREAGVMTYAMLIPLTWLYKRRVGFA